MPEKMRKRQVLSNRRNSILTVVCCARHDDGSTEMLQREREGPAQWGDEHRLKVHHARWIFVVLDQTFKRLELV
jgi:hypothetical protein